MKHTLKSVRALAATLITFGSLAGGANAAITLTIDTLTASTLTFTISGTVPTGFVAPRFPGSFYLTPYAPDVNTEWASSAVLVSNSLIIGVNSISPGFFNNGVGTGDSIYFGFNDNVRPADGTTVSGSATFNGVFNFPAINASDFELYLGQVSARTVSSDHLVATAVAVPEPTLSLLLGLGALGLMKRRHRNK